MTYNVHRSGAIVKQKEAQASPASRSHCCSSQEAFQRPRIRMISFLVPGDFASSQHSRCPLYYPSSPFLPSSSMSTIAFKSSAWNDVIFPNIKHQWCGGPGDVNQLYSYVESTSMESNVHEIPQKVAIIQFSKIQRLTLMSPFYSASFPCLAATWTLRC